MTYITIRPGYTNSNKIYEDYKYRKSNNQYKESLANDERRMQKYMDLYELTNDEEYLKLYTITKSQYNKTLEYYNTMYPKRDDVIIHIKSAIPMSRTNGKSHHVKQIIYPEDWE